MNVLKCLSVVLGLTLHYFPADSFGVKSIVGIGDGEREGPVDPEFEHVMGSTERSLQSAHRHALWAETWSRSGESFVLLAKKIKPYLHCHL